MTWPHHGKIVHFITFSKSSENCFTRLFREFKPIPNEFVCFGQCIKFDQKECSVPHMTWPHHGKIVHFITFSKSSENCFTRLFREFKPIPNVFVCFGQCIKFDQK